MNNESTVFVKGSILITSNKFKCKNMVCYSTIDIPENATIYDENLVIDDDFKNSYFTTFYATEGIASYQIGDILIPSNSPFIVREFHQEIEKYSRLLDTETETDLHPILNRLIFIGSICALDVFLSETFLGLVYSNKELFIKYLKVRGKSHEKNYSDGAIEQKVEIEEEIRKMIVVNTQFQSLSKVAKNLYENILEITFPSTLKMEKHIWLRNDLVHRNGKTKKGHQIIVTNDMINQLFSDSTKFAEEIANKVKHYWSIID